MTFGKDRNIMKPLLVFAVLALTPTQVHMEPPVPPDPRIERIDSYYRKNHMPLAGYGKVMVEEADKNGLDFRLIPALSIRESSGGLHACRSVKNSHLGYGSCKIGFTSTEEEIKTVAYKLTQRPYKGKTTEQLLKTYNPPSIVIDYSKEVIAIMNKI